MSLNVSGLIRVPSTVNHACTARKPASRASELPIVRVWREPVAGERGEPVGAVCRNRDSVGALSTTGLLLPSGGSRTQHRRTRPASFGLPMSKLSASELGRRDSTDHHRHVGMAKRERTAFAPRAARLTAARRARTSGVFTGSADDRAVPYAPGLL